MKNKFVIVDHSLCSLQGHHYECSVSVAYAALKQEYEAIIIANKLFSQDLYPENIKVISAFEVDWFDNSTIDSLLPFWQKYLQLLTKFFSQLSWHEILVNIVGIIQYKLLEIEITKPKLQLFIEKVKGSTFRLVNWFQKDLTLLQYIPFSHTFWGLAKIVFGLCRFLLQIITKILLKFWLKLFNFQPETFIESLTKSLNMIKISPDDHVFIHTIGISQLENLLYWLESQNLTSLPNYHIMLRRDVKDSLVTQAKGIGLQACLHRFYDSQLWQNKVQFYTDTQELINRHNQLSPVKFIEIPVPFRQEKLPTTKQVGNFNKPIHIVYLGDARREKGYHFLPNLVATLWNDYISTGKVKFTIQSNLSIANGETGILEARLKLAQYPDEQVKLIKEVMNADSYYQLLASADLIIIPYDVDSYRYRTSGVFTEALAAGKPVVIPANIWLTTQVDKTRASIYDHYQDIPQSVINAINNREELTKSASKFSLAWRQKHSPSALVNCLLTKHNFGTINQQSNLTISSQQNKPKVLYIIQEDNLINPHFNGVISLSHLQYLSQCGYQLYIIVYSLNTNYNNEGLSNFVNQVKDMIKNYSLAETWFLKVNSFVSFTSDSEKHKYLQQVTQNQSSLSRNLIDIKRLNIPESLITYLQETQLDIIFIDNIASQLLVERICLTQIPLICQMSDLYSYNYAITNNQDIDEDEFKIECQLLAKCKAILCLQQNQGKKLETLIYEAVFYYLPQPLTLNQEIILSQDNQIIDFLWSSRIKEYEQVMNNVCANILQANFSTINHVENGKKIAILYPWGDILERKAGASKRVGLLIDFLKAENHKIWVFSAGDKPDIFENQIRYTFYQQEFPQLSLVKEVYSNSYLALLQQQQNVSNQFITNTLQISEEIAQDWRLSMYNQFRFDSDFNNWIEQIVNWADIIILEYPFWAKTVSKICQKKQVKLIITAHDVIYKQVKQDTAISKILLAEEISSLKTANQVISVSEEDKNLFNQYDVKSLVIPNPVELPKFDLNLIENTPLKFSEKYSWLNKNYCLFVGSNHLPNIEAVNQIVNIAYNYSHQQENIECKFIIVGGCCEELENNNFIALGKVEFELLTILYQKAKLILSPMLSGTGSSLKIMEAMAYGKVILGTKIAFRGYRVESQINCILSDELNTYTEIINNLLAQSDKLNVIGENAKLFAQNYDYRQLYQTYKQLIETTT